MTMLAPAPAPAEAAPRRLRRDCSPIFLETLARSCNVSAAARAVGIRRATAYARRKVDRAFALAWDDVIEGSLDDLEGECFRRALEGSDRLAIFLLRARRPEVYGNR
jgi:hypothetical protein